MQFLANKHVLEIEHSEDKQRIHCFDDEIFEAGTVIVTTPPKEACKIIKGAEGTSLQKWSRQSIPVTVAALDIGLKRLPNPLHQFAFEDEKISNIYMMVNPEKLMHLNVKI